MPAVVSLPQPTHRKSVAAWFALVVALVMSLPAFAGAPEYRITIGSGQTEFQYDKNTKEFSYVDLHGELQKIASGAFNLAKPSSVREKFESGAKVVNFPGRHHVVSVGSTLFYLNEKGQAFDIGMGQPNWSDTAQFEAILDRPDYALIGVKQGSDIVKVIVVTEKAVKVAHSLPARTKQMGFFSTNVPFDLKNFRATIDGILYFETDFTDPWYDLDWKSRQYDVKGVAFDPSLGRTSINEILDGAEPKAKQPEPMKKAPEAKPEPVKKTSGAKPEPQAKQDAAQQAAVGENAQAANAPVAEAGEGKRANPLKAKATAVDDLDKRMRDVVFGQDHLTRRLAEHHSRIREGRPTVLVLTGPSGVGKSYLGRQYAKMAFLDPKLFLEVDGTDYMDTREDSIQHHKLLGSEAAYKGDQKGVLTEWMNENQGDGVLLINEADKMSPVIWKRLMELFEHGKISDGKGAVHHAHRLVIILTSNRGANLMFPPSVANWSEEEIERRLKNLDQETVKRYYMTKSGPNDKFELPREVINRVSEWLVAGPLTEKAVIRIAGVTVDEYSKQLLEEHGLEMELTKEAIRHLALTGFKASDDGRQVVRQTLEYLKNIEDVVGLKWEEVHSSKLKVSLVVDKAGVPSFVVTDGVQKLKVDAPKNPNRNPLQDKAEVERLNSLPTILRQRIIGQDSAIDSITQAVTAARSDGSRRRPVSFFLVGSTGTGKTEIGRGLSLALYGSQDRVNVLSMGDINSESTWAQKFGYPGAESASEFETALMANPEGGVLVFDEVSNMGGVSQEMKRTLFKKLYELTEEGKWTSPLTGKVYDLSKFVFVFTGNDGETLFQGVSSDDMRMAIWKENNPREKVRALLVAAGVPEAFINRMADSILMKPLTRQEIGGVVTKLLKDRIKSFEEQYRGMKITYADSLISDIADSFFTNDRGARGIRSMLEDRFPAVLTFALINSQMDLTDLHGVEVRLSIGDNKTKRPVLYKNTPSRVVEIKLDVYVNGRLVREQKMDVTELASKKVIQGKSEAVVTAIHEAAHAVVNDSEATGERMRYITIEGGFAKGIKYLGYAGYEEIPGRYRTPTRAMFVNKIARLYAGYLAEVMEGYEPSAGWANDLEKIRMFASRAVLELGLEPSLVAVRVDKDGQTYLTAAQEELAQKKIAELIEEGRAYAERKLKEKRPLVRAVAADLLRKGNISGSRFDDLSAAYDKREETRGGMCRALFGK